jgi:hypothetical protein
MDGFPDFPEVNLTDLFEKLDGFLDQLGSFDKSGLTSEKKELLDGLQELIVRNTATLKETLPTEVETMRSDFNRALAGVANQKEELDREVARVRQRLEDMPALVSQARDEADKARQQAEAELEQQIQDLLKPLQRPPQEAALSPGDALRDLLLTNATGAAVTPAKPIGNIWDNWLSVARQEPTYRQEMELRTPEDLEDE